MRTYTPESASGFGPDDGKVGSRAAGRRSKILECRHRPSTGRAGTRWLKESTVLNINPLVRGPLPTRSARGGSGSVGHNRSRLGSCSEEPGLWGVSLGHSLFWSSTTDRGHRRRPVVVSSRRPLAPARDYIQHTPRRDEIFGGPRGGWHVALVVRGQEGTKGQQQGNDGTHDRSSSVSAIITCAFLN